MVHLSLGDVREVPTSEQSFLAGETERVFEPPIGTLGKLFITVWRWTFDGIPFFNSLMRLKGLESFIKTGILSKNMGE
jgi:hypothetical protein